MTTNHFLIDSHVLIWLLYEPEKLGVATKQNLEAAETIYVSAGSLWELALKFSKSGKEKFPYSPQELQQGAAVLGLSRLSISDEHLIAYPFIQLTHKDPFDTLLVAQSKAEGVTLVTNDHNILDSNYKVLDARS